MTEAIEIKLLDIQLLTDLSPRDGIDWNVVEEYYHNIADLPPILVARRKNSFKPFVLIDGWHRYHAHCKTRRDTIWAIVDDELEEKDYYFRAICANKTHGIRFTAAEKKRISRYLFIQENRTAKEISQAIGCSVRHATDLIKSLAQDKKEAAIKLAKRMSDQGISERDIADDLKRRGFKASKSGVNRWLQPEPVPTYMVKDIDAIQVSPQIGESPKRDTEQLVNAGGQPIDDEGRILNLDGEVATVAPYLTPEDFEKLYCAKCKKDSKERTGKWYKITVDTVDSSTVFDFMICSFCRRALGRWVRNE